MAIAATTARPPRMRRSVAVHRWRSGTRFGRCEPALAVGVSELVTVTQHLLLSNLAQHLLASRRRLVPDRNRRAAQLERFFDPASASMVQLDERLPARHAVAWLREHDHADPVIDRIANRGPSGTQ